MVFLGQTRGTNPSELGEPGPAPRCGYRSRMPHSDQHR